MDKEETALLLGGKKENFDNGYFDRLGAVLKLNDKQINAVYKRLSKWLPEAIQMINHSCLDADRQKAYKELISQRAGLFTS